MFTGIVEEVGVVRSFVEGDLTIQARLVLEGAKLGDSITVNGACLTVTALHPDAFTVHTVPETLRRTNLSELKPGDPVNLERALAVGDRMGGHIVQGHIEGTAEVVSYTPDGADGLTARFRAPKALMRYIVPKGFIAVDGASLTVVDCADDSFTVTLIPFTREHTNLAAHSPGGRVNLETDIIARYVERLREP
ncbi:MAG: riboflavin synthase [Chloroflexi bacterium]|nr:riboflavin synthase [Chloroflexota bacterium]